MGLTPDRRIRLNRMFTATEFLAQILLNWIYLIRLYGKIYQMGENRCHSWSIEDGSRRLNGWWFVVWIGFRMQKIESKGKLCRRIGRCSTWRWGKILFQMALGWMLFIANFIIHWLIETCLHLNAFCVAPPTPRLSCSYIWTNLIMDLPSVGSIFAFRTSDPVDQRRAELIWIRKLSSACEAGGQRRWPIMSVEWKCLAFWFVELKHDEIASYCILPNCTVNLCLGIHSAVCTKSSN